MQAYSFGQVPRSKTNSDRRGGMAHSEILEAAGSMQVCGGHQAGSEAAICAMKKTAEHPDTEATLLLDASNAFNTLNSKVALCNIQKICPPLANVLINNILNSLWMGKHCCQERALPL